MSSDVGSDGKVGEEGLERKGWRMSCDVDEVTERLENELCHFHERFFFI